MINIKYLFILVLLACQGCFSSPESNLKLEGTETVGNQILISEQDLTYDEKVALQNELIKRQEEELKSQENELKQLKRQEYYNEALKKYEK